MTNKLKLFENKKVRSHWDSKKEEWYFSVVDTVAILTNNDYQTARKYWKVLKMRLAEEGSELVTNCYQLKMTATDGKQRLTDVLDTKGLLRLIQSIPSPKAEPFKLWLAQVGSERLDEIADPEKAILRATNYYEIKGYDKGWINQRLQSIRVRKSLTDTWKEHGVTTNLDFAILTDEMTKAWSGMTTREYKKFKDLKKESLRDNMTDIELALNMLAEVSTTALTQQHQPKSLNENKNIAKQGGNVAKNAREDLEQRLGKKVISPYSHPITLLKQNLNEIEND